MKKILVLVLVTGLVALGAVGMSSAQDAEPLTSENAAGIVELSRYGNGWVSDIGWSADGSKLVVGGSLGVWLFDAADVTIEPALFSDAVRTVRAAAISPDGTLVAGTSEFGRLYVWSTVDGSLVYITEHAPFILMGVEFSPDGSFLVYNNSASKVVVLDTTSWEMLQELSMAGSGDEYMPLVFSPDGSLLAGVARSGLRLWDTSTWEVLIEEISKVEDVAFNDEGTEMVVGTRDGVLMRYDTMTAEQITSFTVPVSSSKAVGQVDYLPDGRIMAGFARSSSNLMIWDGNADTEPEFLPDLAFGVKKMKLNPSRNILLVITNDGYMRFYDAFGANLALQHEFFNAGFVGADYNETSGQITVASDLKQLLAWDTNTGERSLLSGYVIDLPRETELVTSTPDGSRILSRGTYFIYIMDSATGAVLHEIDPLGNEPESLISPTSDFAVSPDGSLLVVGNSMGHFTFWDLQTGELLLQPKSHTSGVNNISFVNDGQNVLTVSGDGTARLWGLPQ